MNSVICESAHICSEENCPHQDPHDGCWEDTRSFCGLTKLPSRCIPIPTELALLALSDSLVQEMSLVALTRGEARRVVSVDSHRVYLSFFPVSSLKQLWLAVRKKRDKLPRYLIETCRDTFFGRSPLEWAIEESPWQGGVLLKASLASNPTAPGCADGKDADDGENAECAKGTQS